MRRAKAVRKARMFRSLVRIKSQAQLFDATQALELWRVDQLNDQSTLGVIPQRNDVVNGVAIDSLGQVARLTGKSGDAAVYHRDCFDKPAPERQIISEILEPKTKHSDLQ
jgi:hypothetical protein